MRLVPLKQVAVIDRSIASAEDCLTRPYVGLENIEKDTGRFVPGFELKPQEMLATNFRFSASHVLYGKLRPYLNKVVLPDFEGVCTTEILPIMPIDGVLDRTYLWAVLLSSSFVEWASASVAGANLPRLSPSLLAEYEIPLPPLPEQQRIAAILSRADRLRRLRRYALELSDGYLQSVFLEMFGDEKPFKTIKMGDLLLENPKNGLYLPAERYGRGTPIIRINSFYGGVLGESEEFKRVEASKKQVNEFSVSNGDILINRVNSLEYLGKCALVRGLVETTLFESNMIRVRINQSQMLPLFFVTYWSSRKAQTQILKRARKAVNQASINQTDIASVDIPLPNIELQRRFVAIAHRHKLLETQQQEALRQAEHLFQTLLHGAFYGEV